MTEPTTVTPSVVGQLLKSVSWEKATYYRLGGKGRENVLTAQVFGALDLLPRTAYLGSVLRTQTHGAEQAVRLLSDESEDLTFTLLPDDLYLDVKAAHGTKRVSVQPDGLLESKSVFCLMEAKRIKPGSFQPEQLAREYLTVLKFAKARDITPLLLLVLPDPMQPEDPHVR